MAPRTPESILLEMHQHRFVEHGTTDPLEWWEDCVRCDELEGEYAESLAYSNLLSAAIQGPNLIEKPVEKQGSQSEGTDQQRREKAL